MGSLWLRAGIAVRASQPSTLVSSCQEPGLGDRGVGGLTGPKPASTSSAGGSLSTAAAYGAQGVRAELRRAPTAFCR